MDKLVSAIRTLFASAEARRRVGYAVLAAAALVFAYQLGQVRAGYNALAASIAERRLSVELSRLRADHRQATEQLTRLQTDEEVNREAYARVEQQIAQLQDQIMQQQEEVAFYRGIVNGNAQGALLVRDFTLQPAGEGAVRLRFVLAQAGPAQREVRGQLQLRIEGRQEGRLVSLDAADRQLGNVPRGFSLRYFQEVSVDLRIPAGFVPERVVIRAVPSGSGFRPSVESFPWSVRAG